MQIISEINITLVKPFNGLIAFCNFILYKNIYCSSVAIFTRLDGSYRLVYPTKTVGNRNLNIFHPISNEIGSLIEKEVTKKLEDVMNNDRYNSIDTRK